MLTYTSAFSSSRLLSQPVPNAVTAVPLDETYLPALSLHLCSVPWKDTGPMLSPICDRGLQTGNGAPNFGIAGTNGQFSPHRTNVVPNWRSWFPNRKWHTQIWDLLPQTADLVDKVMIVSANPDLLATTQVCNHKKYSPLAACGFLWLFPSETATYREHHSPRSEPREERNVTHRRFAG